MRVRLCVAAALALLACAHLPTSKEKDAAEIHHDLGVEAMRNGKTVEALREFQEAVRLWPDFPEAHNALGLLFHWGLRRLADAEKELRLAVELRPTYSEAWNNLGVLLAERDDTKGARAAFEHALANPVYATPWIAQTNLAWLVFGQGARDEGLQLVKAAISARPDYCMAHRQYARMLEASGQAEAARGPWERFIQACPEEPEALLRAGMKHLHEGDAREARHALERCLIAARERPPADECRSLLARVPAVPEEPAAPPKEPGPGEPGRSVKGSRDLDATP